MRIKEDVKLDFDDVLLEPKHSTISSRNEVDLMREFHFKYSNRVWKGISIISANMISVTNEVVSKIMAEVNMLAGLPKQIKLYPLLSDIVTVGLNEFPEYVTIFLCLDVANGYIQKVVERVSELRKKYPDKVIIAGNVVTPEMTQALILACADIVKIGIGSGAACSTRLKTAIGCPQLSAVIECADSAHGLGGHIISDGGCVTPGDVMKAFAAGADFVMLGGMLAGCEENGSEFYGESSKKANEISFGELKDYRAAEGWEMKIPSKGKLRDVLQDILGGLRSGCSYIGARRIKDVPKCATFIRVNRILNTSMWEYRR